MRGTHHFVTPADIRWLLALLAPRMIQRTQPRWRELGLDEATFKKSQDVMARVLEGGTHLDRAGNFASAYSCACIAPKAATTSTGESFGVASCWLCRRCARRLTGAAYPPVQGTNARCGAGLHDRR